MSKRRDSYDFVIVGGGSAGSALANRLSADPGTTVLVLEAGRSDFRIDPLIHMPAALPFGIGNPLYDWRYETEPEPHMNGRRIYHARGKVLGGSSSINGMIFQRGNPMDYDRWAADPGMETWDFRHCLPYFKRMESLRLQDGSNGADDWRGGDGPLVLERGPAENPLFAAFFEAAQQAGYPLTDDVNGYRQEGFAPFDRNIKDSRRWSAARAYLHPAMRRPNLRVETLAHVTKVNFSGKRAVGVDYLRGGRVARSVSAGEVILSGGAINSPQVMQLSGVGDPGLLGSFGIPVVHDLPGVGENLQDHLEVYIQYAAKQPVSIAPGLAWWKRPKIATDWLFFHKGLGSTNHFEGGGFARSNDEVTLVTLTFLSFGAFGYWEDSMDLLAVTLVSVAITVIIGFPLAILMGINPRAARVITLFLDLLQTMPTFVYLVIVVILFGVGTPTAVVCTLAYALPPIVRIAGFGIRDVSPTTIEATDSLGQTTWQRLWKVQIPMAKSTIILGLNQTILAALSMAIIASYVAGPGLGKPVLAALTQNNFGKGLVPGLLIVLMGIMLDRLTTAASQRSEQVARGGGENVRVRRLTLLGLLVPVGIAVWYSRFAINAAIFPETGWGTWVADKANGWMEAFVNAVEGMTGAFKDFVAYQILNRTEELLANSPWWLAFAALLALSVVIGGVRALLPALICLTGIRLLDLWHDSMLVLNMTIIATALVMLFALVFGVWMARSHRADLVLRPILDAGQTIPAFVYLIPVLALFDVGRFTAIVAGVIYAAPAAIKLVADGISGINQGTVEAGRSSGSTTWQEITKVQLPMAKGSLVLATNQGLLYVLAMVVIGGLVGAQALGYDVIYGLAHSEYWGKGLAAGISIALLGIWIDRVTRAAAERAGAGQAARERAFRIGGWRPAIFTRLSGFGRW